MDGCGNSGVGGWKGTSACIATSDIDVEGEGWEMRVDAWEQGDLCSRMDGGLGEALVDRCVCMYFFVVVYLDDVHRLDNRDGPAKHPGHPA